MTNRSVRIVLLGVLSIAIVAYAILVLLTLNTRHAFQYDNDERDRLLAAIYSDACKVDGMTPIVLTADSRYIQHGSALLLDSRRTFVLGKSVLDKPNCISAVVSELARCPIPTYVVIRDSAAVRNSIVLTNR